MKHVLLCAVPATCRLTVYCQFTDVINIMNSSEYVGLDNHENEGFNNGSHEEPDSGQMLAVVLRTRNFAGPN